MIMGHRVNGPKPSHDGAQGVLLVNVCSEFEDLILMKKQTQGKDPEKKLL